MKTLTILIAAFISLISIALFTPSDNNDARTTYEYCANLENVDRLAPSDAATTGNRLDAEMMAVQQALDEAMSMVTNTTTAGHYRITALNEEPGDAKVKAACDKAIESLRNQMQFKNAFTYRVLCTSASSPSAQVVATYAFGI